MSKIIGMIIITREYLKETQEQFGKRFNTTAMAVSYWEKGMRRAPYEVIEYCMDFSKNIKTCDTCEGKGYILLSLTETSTKDQTKVRASSEANLAVETKEGEGH